jgi:hypothetical protein
VVVVVYVIAGCWVEWSSGQECRREGEEGAAAVLYAVGGRSPGGE